MKNFRLSFIMAAAVLAACSPKASDQSLKEAYSDSFMIGCAVNPRHTSGRLTQANELLFKHFNAILHSDTGSAIIRLVFGRGGWRELPSVESSGKLVLPNA